MNDPVRELLDKIKLLERERNHVNDRLQRAKGEINTATRELERLDTLYTDYLEAITALKATKLTQLQHA